MWIRRATSYRRKNLWTQNIDNLVRLIKWKIQVVLILDIKQLKMIIKYRILHTQIRVKLGNSNNSLLNNQCKNLKHTHINHFSLNLFINRTLTRNYHLHLHPLLNKWIVFIHIRYQFILLHSHYNIHFHHYLNIPQHSHHFICLLEGEEEGTIQI